MKSNAFRLALAGATMLAGLGTAVTWSAPAAAQAGQAALRPVTVSVPEGHRSLLAQAPPSHGQQRHAGQPQRPFGRLGHSCS